jgi:hypothetical protein
MRLYIDGDDVDLAVHRLGDGRHARDQPAAAERHHQHVDLGDVLEHLERHGALPRDDARVVKGMDEGQPLLGLELAGMGIGRVEGLAFEDHGRAMTLGLRHFHRGGVLRHHDRARDAEPRRVIGQPLRMIARRRGDHPGRVRGKLKQRIERPPLFVSGRELKVLELQINGCPSQLGQRPADQRRGAHHRVADTHPRRPDIVEGYGKLRLGGCGLGSHGVSPRPSGAAGKLPVCGQSYGENCIHRAWRDGRPHCAAPRCRRA